MKLLQRLKWWGKPETHQALEDVLHDASHTVVVEAEPELVIRRPGGVRKTKHKQYVLDDHPHGGRVVKTMPRQLRHMKELAEKTDD